MNRLIKLLSTCFGAGYFPKMPGLAGSLFGLFLWYFTKDIPLLQDVFTVVVILTGFLVCGKAEKVFGEKDCQKIVIDEASGILIVLSGVKGPAFLVCILFVLFRVLDMTKPWPFNKLQSLRGSLGVMADDIAVAVLINAVYRFVFSVYF